MGNEDTSGLRFFHVYNNLPMVLRVISSKFYQTRNKTVICVKKNTQSVKQNLNHSFSLSRKTYIRIHDAKSLKDVKIRLKSDCETSV